MHIKTQKFKTYQKFIKSIKSYNDLKNIQIIIQIFKFLYALQQIYIRIVKIYK